LKDGTRTGENTHMEYARYADDVVILVDGNERYRVLLEEIMKRIESALEKVEVELNREKTRTVDLARGESFDFLGFEFRRLKSKNGKWRPDYRPRMKSRRKLTQEIKEICEANKSRPVSKLISEINPVVRGWVNYFRIGHSTKTFQYVHLFVEKKVRRHMTRAMKRKGFGWKMWSSPWIYGTLGLYNDYRIRYYGESIPGRKVS